MFDGSAIEGFVRVEESDTVSVSGFADIPDLSVASSAGQSARLICDVYRPNHTPFEGDSRYVLKKVLEKSTRHGLSVQCRARM